MPDEPGSGPEHDDGKVTMPDLVGMQLSRFDDPNSKARMPFTPQTRPAQEPSTVSQPGGVGGARGPEITQKEQFGDRVASDKNTEMRIQGATIKPPVRTAA